MKHRQSFPRAGLSFSGVVSTAATAAIISVSAILSGCSHQPLQQDGSLHAQDIPVFSNGTAGQLPAGWTALKLMRTKPSTDYVLVNEDNALPAGAVSAGPAPQAAASLPHTVLRAQAVASSSLLHHRTDIDPVATPWLHWRWKADSLIATADNTKRDTEDSPTRIVLAFDGDKETLSAMDQILFDTTKLLTGHDLPYATLMYIWENKQPVGTVIANSRTGQIQKMVVESGPAGVGQWRSYSRNIVADYQKAFGALPGRLIGIGVMTDTDNTGETVQAWYGDIRLDSAP